MDVNVHHLRILIANERRDRLAVLANVVTGLGHEVIAREIDVDEVGAATAAARPDVALVALGASRDHALELIDKIVHEAKCPVIALLGSSDPDYVSAAARRGAFAYIGDTSPAELQNTIEITLQRFTEYRELEGVLDRRTVIEQAKGVLMAHHGVGPDLAYTILREHSRRSGHKVADLAQALVDSYAMLAWREPSVRAPPHAVTCPA